MGRGTSDEMAAMAMDCANRASLSPCSALASGEAMSLVRSAATPALSPNRALSLGSNVGVSGSGVGCCVITRSSGAALVSADDAADSAAPALAACGACACVSRSSSGGQLAKLVRDESVSVGGVGTVVVSGMIGVEGGVDAGSRIHHKSPLSSEVIGVTELCKSKRVVMGNGLRHDVPLEKAQDGR